MSVNPHKELPNTKVKLNFQFIIPKNLDLPDRTVYNHLLGFYNDRYFACFRHHFRRGNQNRFILNHSGDHIFTVEHLYDGCYYLVKAKEPADEAAIYREIGPEEYFKKKYGGTRLSIVGDGSSPDAFSSYYTEKSRINDEQYLLTDYELAYDDS